MSGLYYRITKAEVCRLAYELASMNKIKHMDVVKKRKLLFSTYFQNTMAVAFPFAIVEFPEPKGRPSCAVVPSM